MEDEQAMGKVILNKTDKDTKKPMKGVEFALCDSKGKVLETLVTDSAGHAESKNYPIATFKNGQYKKAITYILKETKTLDGYQLDETEHKIQFEYVNDRTPVIEYTLDLTNEKAPEKILRKHQKTREAALLFPIVLMRLPYPVHQKQEITQILLFLCWLLRYQQDAWEL